MIKFKTNSSEIDAAASSAEAKRLVRAVKANPNFKFEIQVLLSGYLEDSVRSNPDLTEIIYDSIHTTYDDIDSLGQFYERDTVIAKITYHNDRTWNQAKSLIKYLISQGLSENSFAFFGNAIPAALPENKKLTVKAVVRAKK
jgi:hypothetical protein